MSLKIKFSLRTGSYVLKSTQKILSSSKIKNTQLWKSQ